MRLPKLTELLGSLGVTGEFQLGGSYKNRISIKCPFAPWSHEKGSDSHPSMGIWLMPDGAVTYKCWACHRSGNLFGMFREIGGLTNNPQLIAIAEQIVELTKVTEAQVFENLMDDIRTWGGPKERQALTLPPKILHNFPEAYSFPSCEAYLKSRQVSSLLALEFDLRVDPRDARCVFPVFDRVGMLVGAVGRDITGKSPKRYFNYFSFSAGAALGGLYQSLKLPLTKVLVVEGYFSLLRIWPWAKERQIGVVCSWKCELSDSHVKQLASLDVPVQIWYDPDPAGQRGAIDALAKGANHALNFKIATLPIGKDPGQLTGEEFQIILETTNSKL